MNNWMALSGGVPCGSLVALGMSYQDKYYMSEDCLFYINEMMENLNCEDSISRPQRRALGFMNILKKDLIPILINSEINKDRQAVFRATIKLLVDLTVPVECLVCVETADQSPTSLHIVHELTQHLYNAKEAFLDPRATRAIVDHLNRLMEKQPLSSEDSESVNHSLLLIRNILHAPERPPMPLPPELSTSGDEQLGTVAPGADSNVGSQKPYLGPHLHSHGFTSDCSQQNRLLWNLFAQGLDRLLINLLACPQKNEWVVTIVQLIALFYKDQHVEHMQKLLGTWLNATSDSSVDDDESNTSPPDGARDSPQMMTSSSDPTSDSSDSAQRNASGDNQSCDNAQAAECESHAEGNVKSSRNKGHRSSAAAAIHGDTASNSSHSSSAAISHVSLQSDSSVQSSQHSVSSGFHSQHSAINRKDSDGPKSSSANTGKRRSHATCSQTATRPSENTSSKTNTSVEGLQVVESSTKRNPKSEPPKSTKSAPEKEQRRKKLYKRSHHLGRVRIKAMVQYTPTEEDISQLLREFTVDFLMNGYNALVGELHRQLLRQDNLPLDKSHFLWLITYFLRFAAQLELDAEHLKDVFTIDLLCYLISEAVRETEDFEIGSLQHSVDLKPCLRRLHLGVTAIREYLQALETYSRHEGKHSSNSGAVEKVGQLRDCLPAMKDLRQLFLLQLRHFNPVIQSKRYLRDIITANHVLLLTLERATHHSPFAACFDLRQHLNQFCSRAILDKYGTALEDFKTNGPFVNDCILTVLHHIGADLDRADLLCEPVILRPFSKIWEEEFNMCDDWDDLIEYVLQKFMRSYQSNGGYSNVDSPHRSAGSARSLESDRGDSNMGDVFMSSEEAYSEGMVMDIESLKGRLMDSGFQKQLDWIQSCLLTMCSARLGTYVDQEFRNPIACISQRMNIACPMVPWTELEASALRSEVFIFLLHKMGLLPASPAAGLFPRIPKEWNSDALYSVALFLGPVDQQRIDFDLALVHQIDLPIPNPPDADGSMDGYLPSHPSHHPWLRQPYLGPGPSTSFSAMPHHWLHWAGKNGSLFRSAEMASYGHPSSVSNNSHRPMDSVSTTSSLEVHKTDSSDDDDMEEGATANTSSVSKTQINNERTSAGSSIFSREEKDMNLERAIATDNTDSDELFEMTPIRDEVSNISAT